MSMAGSTVSNVSGSIGWSEEEMSMTANTLSNHTSLLSASGRGIRFCLLPLIFHSVSHHYHLPTQSMLPMFSCRISPYPWTSLFHSLFMHSVIFFFLPSLLYHFSLSCIQFSSCSCPSLICFSHSSLSFSTVLLVTES